MKKTIHFQKAYLLPFVLSVLFFVLTFVFHTCVHDGVKGKCYNAELMVRIVTIVMMVISFVPVIIKNKYVNCVINSLMLICTVLILLTPKVIMPICQMSSMQCVKAFYPFVMVYGCIFAVIMFIYCFISIKKAIKRG